MCDLVIIFVHVIATLARLFGPSGIRSVVAESVLIKQQLLILNRSRQRSPQSTLFRSSSCGLCALLIRPARLDNLLFVACRYLSMANCWWRTIPGG